MGDGEGKRGEEGGGGGRRRRTRRGRRARARRRGREGGREGKGGRGRSGRGAEVRHVEILIRMTLLLPGVCIFSGFHTINLRQPLCSACGTSSPSLVHLSCMHACVHSYTKHTHPSAVDFKNQPTIHKSTSLPIKSQQIAAINQSPPTIVEVNHLLNQ